MTNAKKKLPVGIEDFAKIRIGGFYYVDKTAMIRDLLNAWGEVNLFTRPRRFGKSLNMSMLKSFFEIGCDKTLFDGLEISDETALCDKYMGQFPVVSISLKGVEGTNYSMARSMAVDVINEEARRLGFLLKSSKLISNEKELLSRLMDKNMDDGTLASSLRNLTELLKKHYGKNVIVLIDEYDVPLAKANECGYYGEIIKLIRGIFYQALKTNPNLEFAVLTGCLRVAKESIFTGLNNLKIHSITSVRFDEYFGFTDAEVKAMLEYYGFTDKYDAVKEWYDGYRFGNINVYCPWDVINYCDDLLADPETEPKNYWSNTSGNDAVRHFIEKVDNGLAKGDVETLVAGETVIKEIYEDLTYNSIYDSIDNMWSVLFATGYLTQSGRPEGREYHLTIPNREIRSIFTEQIMAMFKKKVAADGERMRAFCEALQNGDAAEVEKQFTAYLNKTASIRDTFVQKPTKENYYHGILIGILGYKDDWYVRSNKDAGDSYSDIFIEIEDKDIGIIIEVKYANREQLVLVCKTALEQIEQQRYADDLKADGYREIYKYGIACYKRRCMVICAKEELKAEE
ncbi:MAG: ATP-binding protein [Oscillospiraceae bacterium]|nr:ATP-binding protein [Oscillospiraceae bacterium]